MFRSFALMSTSSQTVRSDTVLAFSSLLLAHNFDVVAGGGSVKSISQSERFSSVSFASGSVGVEMPLFSMIKVCISGCSIRSLHVRNGLLIRLLLSAAFEPLQVDRMSSTADRLHSGRAMSSKSRSSIAIDETEGVKMDPRIRQSVEVDVDRDFEIVCDAVFEDKFVQEGTKLSSDV